MRVKAGLIGMTFAVAASASGQSILDERFDDRSLFSGGAQFFSDGGTDYFGLTSGDFGGGAAPSLKSYSGFGGSYLTGQDMDGEGLSLPAMLEWSGLDISGVSQWEARFDAAEFFDAPGDIDASDQLRLEYQVDGGGFQDLIRFEAIDFDSGSSNGVFAQDTDFDGVGDGLVLNATAQTFSALVDQKGTELDLRLHVSMNSGDEDFAFDNLRITAVPEPREYAMAVSFALVGLAALRRRFGKQSDESA